MRKTLEKQKLQIEIHIYIGTNTGDKCQKSSCLPIIKHMEVKLIIFIQGDKQIFPS